MDASALTPILAFTVPFLVGRQIITSSAMKLSDSDKLALFPVSRVRQRLTWLILPIVVAIFLAASATAMNIIIAIAVVFLVLLEVLPLIQIRRLTVAPEFKRQYAIGTGLTCLGFALAAALLIAQAHAP